MGSRLRLCSLPGGAVTFFRNDPVFGSEDLLLELVHHSGDGRIHVGGNFLAVMEIVTGLDLRFSDVPLVFFDGKDEVNLHDLLKDAVHSFDTVRSELTKGLRDLDMATCDIHFHLYLLSLS